MKDPAFTSVSAAGTTRMKRVFGLRWIVLVLARAGVDAQGLAVGAHSLNRRARRGDRRVLGEGGGKSYDERRSESDST